MINLLNFKLFNKTYIMNNFEDSKEEKFFQKVENKINKIKICEKVKVEQKFYSKYVNEIQKMCKMANVEYTGLSQDDLYELTFKPENIVAFKKLFFSQIKENIDTQTDVWLDIINDNNDTEITFENCRNLLIDFILEWFENEYIFSMDISQFLTKGSINTDSSIVEVICCDRLYRYL
jgi:hypothetical protein